MSTPVASPGQPHVGWTAPTISYDMMRKIDASAAELNSFVVQNVIRESFKLSWSVWYTRWRQFFAKYQDTLAKLGAAFYSDALYQQVLTYRTELEAFQKGYAAERDAKGEPLPATVTPVPPGPLVVEPPKTSLLPWWGWLLVGGGVLAVGYYAYKRYVAVSAVMNARGRALEAGTAKMLPEPFGSTLKAGSMFSGDPSHAMVSDHTTLLLNDTPIPK